MSEWNLSEKIIEEGENTWGFKSGWLDVDDVREFIRRLKEKIIFGDSHEIIDKLAGEELSK